MQNFIEYFIEVILKKFKIEYFKKVLVPQAWTKLIDEAKFIFIFCLL